MSEIADFAQQRLKGFGTLHFPQNWLRQLFFKKTPERYTPLTSRC